MGLSGGNSNGSTTVFFSTGTIQSAKSISNKGWNSQEKAWTEDGENPCDIGVIVTVDVPGQTFTKDLKISGNFNKEKPNEWSGSAYGVKIFLENMRLKNWEINDDNSIPEEILEQLVGKEVAYLTYPGAKNGDKIKQYQYKNIVLKSFFSKKHNQNAEQFLRARYAEDVAAGYVKPYNDDAAEDASFDPHAFAGNVPATV